MLDKLQKKICRNADLLLAAFFELLARHRKVTSFKSFAMSITLADFRLTWQNWFHFFILVGGWLVILIGFMIILSSFLDLVNDDHASSFFLHTTRF